MYAIARKYTRDCKCKNFNPYVAENPRDLRKDIVIDYKARIFKCHKCGIRFLGSVDDYHALKSWVFQQENKRKSV